MPPARCLLLLALPLCAQSAPELRQDALSFGIGIHSTGPLATFMTTGSGPGFFLGLAARLPGSAMEGSDIVPHTGKTTVTRSLSQAHSLHAGLAWRLDHRWVVGLGVGREERIYDRTVHLGSDMAMPDLEAAGPMREATTGPVAMVDVRLGANWGLHVAGGPAGTGAALTWRF